jgi:SET domain-containing protein
MWLRGKLSKKDNTIRFEDIIIELKPSNINGIGVFAAKPLKRNEFIAEGIHKNN